MKPIHVFLRHCYYSKIQELPDRNRPVWFNKEKVFENFKNTIDPELADYTIVYDEHFGSIEDTFLKDEKNVEIINCGKETTSFLRTLDIVQSKNFHDDKIIYFLEDDYLHRPNWCSVILEGLSNNFDYISLCDHKVNYIVDSKSIVSYTKSTHWRNIMGCTNSFATTIKTLIEDEKYHRDYSSLLAISMNQLKMLRYENSYIKDEYSFSDDYSKFYNLYLRKSRKIGCTIPGFSCHCEEKDMMYIIQWEDYINIPKSKNILLYS